MLDFNPDLTALENIAVLEDIRAVVSSFSIFESNTGFHGIHDLFSCSVFYLIYSSFD